MVDQMVLRMVDLKAVMTVALMVVQKDLMWGIEMADSKDFYKAVKKDVEKVGKKEFHWEQSMVVMMEKL